MRGLGWAMIVTLAAIGALVLAWGVWLLVTADPDGGRHPVGGFLVAVGLLFLAPTFLAVLRKRRS